MKYFLNSISLFTLLMSCLNNGPLYAQAGNVGIGTTSPTTKLDVNGAITNREGTAIAVSGTTVTIPNLANSQYRLTGSPTATFSITGPTTSNGTLALVAGARLILVNTTSQIGTLNGAPIQPGTAQEFAYTNGAWVATNGGARPDYDWKKEGGGLPLLPGDTASRIYRAGNVSIGATPSDYTLLVQATADFSDVVATNLVAGFYPFGGSDFNKPASISINERAFFGYDIHSTTGKYAFVRGNQLADIRFQVMDGNGVIDSSALFIQGAANGFGSVGINTDVPQSRLDVRGNLKVLPDTITQTGNLWSGTSNMNGFEVQTDPTTKDAWVGIQRRNGACLHLSKPAGTPAGQAMLIFAVNGSYVGNVTYNGTGVTYNVTSDTRLKESIRSTRYSLKDVMKIKVADYFYKSDKDHSYPQTGFLAQQLYDVFPTAVTKGGANPKEEPWMIDYSKVTPLLVKSVQELTHRVERLEKENELLKEQSAIINKLAEELKALKQLVGVKEKNANSTIVKK